MMVHKFIFVIFKSYNVLFVNTIQLMSMLKMFPMGKIRALWTITKIMVHLWNNMYFLNMWKNARGGSCYWCIKYKVMEFKEEKQNKEECPSFHDFIKCFATNNLITKVTLHNMPFLKTWSYTFWKVTICCPLLKVHN